MPASTAAPTAVSPGNRPTPASPRPCRSKAGWPRTQSRQLFSTPATITAHPLVVFDQKYCFVTRRQIDRLQGRCRLSGSIRPMRGQVDLEDSAPRPVRRPVLARANGPGSQDALALFTVRPDVLTARLATTCSIWVESTLTAPRSLAHLVKRVAGQLLQPGQFGETVDRRQQLALSGLIHLIWLQIRISRCRADHRANAVTARLLSPGKLPGHPQPGEAQQSPANPLVKHTSSLTREPG
jgi:hypothetical protein